jgi:hypothetical protein
MRLALSLSHEAGLMSGGTLLKELFAFALLTTQQLISRLPQEKINSCHPSSSYLSYVWLRWVGTGHWVQVNLHTKRVHTHFSCKVMCTSTWCQLQLDKSPHSSQHTISFPTGPPHTQLTHNFQFP